MSRGAKVLVTLFSAAVVACGGGNGLPPTSLGDGPVIATGCDKPSLPEKFAIFAWTGIPLVAAVPVSREIIGFSVGGHPAWQKWELDMMNQRILVTGTPTAPQDQLLSITLTTRCGTVATVDGGIIVIRTR